MPVLTTFEVIPGARDPTGSAGQTQQDLDPLARLHCSARAASGPATAAAGTEGTLRCNYGRSCGVLRARGQDVGALLIAEGLARTYVCGRRNDVALHNARQTIFSLFPDTMDAADAVLARVS